MQVSYATGMRPGDAGGAGPGMYYATAMIQALAAAGFDCFSGLCIPGGVDWKVFLLRLKVKQLPQAKAKVLVVLQTKAFYNSVPCAKEVRAMDKAMRSLVSVGPCAYPNPVSACSARFARPFGKSGFEQLFGAEQVHTALSNGVMIIPVRVEDDLPPAAAQWPDLRNSANSDDMLLFAELQVRYRLCPAVPLSSWLRHCLSLAFQLSL